MLLPLFLAMLVGAEDGPQSQYSQQQLLLQQLVWALSPPQEVICLFVVVVWAQSMFVRPRRRLLQ
jgi:hypothetical protein